MFESPLAVRRLQEKAEREGWKKEKSRGKNFSFLPPEIVSSLLLLLSSRIKSEELKKHKEEESLEPKTNTRHTPIHK